MPDRTNFDMAYNAGIMKNFPESIKNQ